MSKPQLRCNVFGWVVWSLLLAIFVAGLIGRRLCRRVLLLQTVTSARWAAVGSSVLPVNGFHPNTQVPLCRNPKRVSYASTTTEDGYRMLKAHFRGFPVGKLIPFYLIKE